MNTVMPAPTQVQQRRGSVVLTGQYIRLKDKKQTMRIQVGNALDAVNRGVSVLPPGDTEKLIALHTRYLAEEAEYEDLIRELVADHPIAEYLKNVKGASTINCAPLVAELDPYKAKHVSSFWKFVGYGMGDYWAELKPKYGYKWDFQEEPRAEAGEIPLDWVDAAGYSGHEVWQISDLTEEILDDIMGYSDAFDQLWAGKEVSKKYSHLVILIRELQDELRELNPDFKPIDLRGKAPPGFWRQIDPILTAKYLAGRYTIVAPISGSKFHKVKGEKVKYTVVPEPEDDWILVRSIDRQIKDWVSPYNKNLRVMCFRICAQFIRMGVASPYEVYYRNQRRMYESRGWPKGRVHLASVRKTMKLFLQHMWITWRQIEGLPISKPYPIAKLGHTTYLKPEDYGWFVDKE